MHVVRICLPTQPNLHKDLPRAKTPFGQESLKRQIAATDKTIDALVYDWSDSGKCRPTAQLHGLTEEETGSTEDAGEGSSVTKERSNRR
jgi:hypothetical protein